MGRTNEEIDCIVLRALLTNHDPEAIGDLLRLDDRVVHSALARLQSRNLVTSEGTRDSPRQWRLTVAGIAAVLPTINDLELLQL